MKDATLNAFRDCDIAILAAAVADFTPETTRERKMKHVVHHY